MTPAELEAEIARQRALMDYWRRWAVEEGLLPPSVLRAPIVELPKERSDLATLLVV